MEIKREKYENVHLSILAYTSFVFLKYGCKMKVYARRKRKGDF